MSETDEKWYSKSLDRIYDSLNTSKEGLTDKEALSRVDKFGYNELDTGKKIQS
ncbi:MAG: hypothetical protein KKC26_06745 [Nanoarchaeota archaeon]|nr:hypothetical protein [Nanoarchaeota archaeon]MBU1849235.1 hypothetical protein [Nanoarchaeota archaeon]